MATDLPPFSGEEAPCTKCSYEGASVEYRPFGKCLHDGSGFGRVVGTASNERLHRECVRCGHEWDEATVSTAAP